MTRLVKRMRQMIVKQFGHIRVVFYNPLFESCRKPMFYYQNDNNVIYRWSLGIGWIEISKLGRVASG